MFNCQKCGTLSKPNENPEKIVTMKRPKSYENRVGDKIRTTYGWEIVQEQSVCKSCAKESENG